MKKHKINFKKNSIMMLSLVVVIALGIFFIDILKDKTENGVKLGGRFLLIDHNEMHFDSKTSNKNKLIYQKFKKKPNIKKFLSLIKKGQLPRPHYGLPLLLAAQQAKDLGLKKLKVM